MQPHHDDVLEALPRRRASRSGSASDRVQVLEDAVAQRELAQQAEDDAERDEDDQPRGRGTRTARAMPPHRRGARRRAPAAPRDDARRSSPPTATPITTTIEQDRQPSSSAIEERPAPVVEAGAPAVARADRPLLGRLVREPDEAAARGDRRGSTTRARSGTSTTVPTITMIGEVWLAASAPAGRRVGMPRCRAPAEPLLPELPSCGRRRRRCRRPPRRRGRGSTAPCTAT